MPPLKLRQKLLRRPKATAEVWMFHRVRNASEDIGSYPPISLSPQAFDAFLARKCKERQPFSVTDAIDSQSGFLVTFDDGYRDNLEIALPLLEKHQVPATIFITTKFVDGTLEPIEETWAQILRDAGKADLHLWESRRIRLKYGRLKNRRDRLKELAKEFNVVLPNVRSEHFLTWDQVVELDKHPLITIGLHCCTHTMLNRIGPIQLIEEVVQAKSYLESKIGHSVETMSYPYGAHNILVRQVVRLAGFVSAFTTKSGYMTSGTHPLSIPRLDSSLM